MVEPMPPTRKWASTETPEARRAIRAGVAAFTRAMDARNQMFREQYAAGVDVRDLVRLSAEYGLALSTNHMFKIVKGARDKPAPE
jgi:hypothetical protein